MIGNRHENVAVVNILVIVASDRFADGNEVGFGQVIFSVFVK